MARSRKRGKPRQRTGVKSASREAIILIPLTYNDGTKVPREVLASIREEIFLTFHGWTMEGRVKGAYRMRSGEKRVEDHQKLSVVLDAAQVPELEAMVARWGALFGQETMLLKLSEFVVKFIPPQPEEEA